MYPGNKSFTGPILSSLSVANPKSYQNTMVISNFIESYGAIYIASDIKDTCGEHIISGVGDKDKNIKDYEKIYNICENTILPAVKARYKYWATCNLNDYEFMNLEDNQELVKEGLSRDWINFLKGYFFPIKLIIPVIITSKTILIPKLKNGEVIDVKKKNFLFYLHSAQKPKNHQPLITTTADIGVFICHEKSLNSFVDYIKRMQNMILEKVSESLSKRPRGFWEDYRQLKTFKKYL